MRLRSPALSRTSRGAITCAGAVAALYLLSAPNASAALSGTFNGNLSATGNTQISPSGAVGPFTVGVSGPSFCVGPPLACGSGSGVSGSTSVTATTVTAQFFGSTAGAGPGSFTETLTFGAPNLLITNVTESGSLGGGTLTFSHTSNSITFTETTGSDFNAIGGNTLTFTVTSATVPEPGSVFLLGTALAGAAVFLKRRRLPGIPRTEE